MEQPHKMPNLKKIDRLLLAQEEFHSSRHSDRNGYHSVSITRAYVQVMIEDQHRLAKNTFNRRCSQGNHVIRFFKTKQLSELTTRHVEAYVRSRLAEGARRSTVNGEVLMIAKLLRRAILRRLCSGQVVSASSTRSARVLKFRGGIDFARQHERSEGLRVQRSM